MTQFKGKSVVVTGAARARVFAQASRALVRLCSEQAADIRGEDFSLKTPEGRRQAGLDSR